MSAAARGGHPEPEWKNLPTIQASDLLKGVGPGEKKASGSLATSPTLLRIEGPVSLNIAVDQTSVKFNVECEGWSQGFRFDIIRQRVGNSERMYFVCPFSKERVAKLYVYDGGVISKPAYRMASFPQKLADLHALNRATAALLKRPGAVLGPRKQFVADLLRLGPGPKREIHTIYAREAWKAEREAEYRARVFASRTLAPKPLGPTCDQADETEASKPPPEVDRLGTPAGLKLSRRLRRERRPKAADGPGFLWGVQGSEAQEWPLRPPPEALWAAMEDHPRLDIRVLSREGYLRPGEVTLVDLHWKGSRAEIASACLAIDMREGRGHEIRVAFDSPEGPRVQTLGLFLKAMGRRTRPFMVCSRTGEDVEVMPYRFGGFAQPAFLKLTYRTQLVPKSKRRKIKPGKTRVRPRTAAQ